MAAAGGLQAGERLLPGQDSLALGRDIAISI